MYAILKPFKTQRRPGLSGSRARAARRHSLGWLGDVCSVDVNGNRVCSSNPTANLGVPIVGARIVGVETLPVNNLRFRTPGFPGVTMAPTTPVTPTSPYSPPWGGWNSTTTASTVPAEAIAQLLQLYQSNPCALSASQWAQLQQVGIIPSTLPQSSCSLVAGTTAGASAATAASTYNDPECLALGMTGGPYPNCTPAAGTAAASPTDFLDTQYGPLTGLEWLLVAGGAYLLFKRK